MIQILEEPYGNTYKSLLKLALNVCDEFILVKRDQIPLFENGNDILKTLNPFLKEVKKQESWPGTCLMGHFADVYYFECREDLVDVFTEHTESLYSWMQPHILEDLCFFKDKKPWLITVSHEKMGWIDTNNVSELEKLKEFKGLVTY
ncbi:hypothetical protein [Paenibacillus puerhi]|uniref:hypothetical protein n=1 Tax=Paenibacillus puerhi TaxID=2692622 RepID=UPI00135989F1|nr:hypothetical protein [Paenibacillus puerhi]